MTMQDRMTVVPQTVEAVEAFLDRNRIALARKLRRSAGGPTKSIMTRQKIGDPLEYVTLTALPQYTITTIYHTRLQILICLS